ncbi:unnamed protein product, partial [Mesorhabditis spiculigera]
MLRMKTRRLCLQTVELVSRVFEILSKGGFSTLKVRGFLSVSLDTLFDSTVRPLSTLLPGRARLAVDILGAFILFHLFLIYVLIYGGIRFVTQNTRLKGRKIVPSTPELLEVVQNVSVWVCGCVAVMPAVTRLTIGVPFLSSWFGRLARWVPSLKPQINIKPQVKLVQKDGKTKVELGMDELKPKMAVGLEPADKQVATILKGVRTTTDCAVAAQQLGEAAEQSDFAQPAVEADQEQEDTSEPFYDAFSVQASVSDHGLIDGVQRLDESEESSQV